jgi:hypothetical protein
MTKADVEQSAIQKVIEALTPIANPKAEQFITYKPAVSVKTTPTTTMACHVDAPRALDFRDTRTLRQFTNRFINSSISAG